ncbi:MAG: hypothetical protein ACRDZ8_13915 [Acidimicrobiales bacterium]
MQLLGGCKDWCDLVTVPTYDVAWNGVNAAYFTEFLTTLSRPQTDQLLHGSNVSPAGAAHSSGATRRVSRHCEWESGSRSLRAESRRPTRRPLASAKYRRGSCVNAET